MRFGGNQASSHRPKKSCVIIYNPHAGKLKRKGSDRLEPARRILTEAGYETTLVPTSGPGAAVALARQYRERGNEAYALWLLGRIGLQDEPVDHAGIEQLVRAALDIAGGSGMQPLITKCHGVLTELQQRLGDSHEASTRPTPAAHTG